jgi:CRAL/TRIO domain
VIIFLSFSDHYIYINEYMWQVLEANRPLATMTSIIDLEGLNLSLLRQSDLVAFLKIFVKTMDSHFPQRANKTFLVNTPKWFNVLYKMLSPLLRESTKEKIFIFSNGAQQDEALKHQLSSDSLASLPRSFWSIDKKSLSPVHFEEHSQSSLEQQLREFVSAKSA